MTLRPRQLNAHQRSFDPAEQKKDECGYDVTQGDVFVIGISEPANKTSRPGPGALELAKLVLFSFGQLPSIQGFNLVLILQDTSPRRSLETLQIVQQRHQVISRQTIWGHPVAGFDLLGVSHPLREMVAIILERRRSNCVSAGEVSEVWSYIRTRRRSVYRMAHHAS